MEKKVKVGDKEYTVKEIKYKDIAELGDADTKEAARLLMKLSAGLTDEEYDELTMREGIELQKAINELNGLTDFQKPLTE